MIEFGIGEPTVELKDPLLIFLSSNQKMYVDDDQYLTGTSNEISHTYQRRAPYHVLDFNLKGFRLFKNPFKAIGRRVYVLSHREIS
jgi:hypothetical protein